MFFNNPFSTPLVESSDVAHPWYVVINRNLLPEEVSNENIILYKVVATKCAPLDGFPLFNSFNYLSTESKHKTQKKINILNLFWKEAYHNDILVYLSGRVNEEYGNIDIDSQISLRILHK